MAGMTDISPAAAAARENARTTIGQFGTQERTAPEVTLGSVSLAEARVLVGQLEPGMSVILTTDGRDYPCIVQRREEGFGHPDSKNVTVGYGPGRWNQEVNAAGLAAGNYGLRIETNFQRLQREAANTDPTHPDFNSDLDIIVPGITKSYRDMLNAGIDPNDETARDGWVTAQLGLTTVPMEERSPAELVATIRREIPGDATVLFEETDQGGRWLNPIGVLLGDGTRLDSAEAEDHGIDWEYVEWAASNVRGFDHPDFTATDRLGGYWELPPASN